MLAQEIDHRTNVAQLNESVRLLEEEINVKKAQLDSKVVAARKLQDQHGKLQAQVDETSDSLAIADSQHSYFQARLAQLLATIPDIWAISNNQVVRYDGVLECERAIQDFKRVRPLLLDRVNSAEAKLTEFEREHGL